VEESSTVLDLKGKIFSDLKLGEVAEQKLIYQGKILKDEQTIASVGMKDGAIVVLMLSKIKKAAPAAADAAASSSAAAPAAAAAAPAAAAAAPEAAAPAASPAPATAAPLPSSGPQPAPAPAVGGAATPPTPAAAPAASPVAGGTPAPAPAAAAESSLAIGAGLEPVIADLMALGFPRDQVQAALRAAYNNADRAADYLFNGIPDSVLQQMAHAPAPRAGGAPQAANPPQAGGSPAQQPQQPQQQAQGGGGDNPQADALAQLMANSQAGGGGVNPNNPLAALGNSPQFQQMRAILQQQPQLIPVLLQQLAQSEPALAQLIAQNPEALADLLAGGGGGGGGGGAPGAGGQPRSHTIQITMEEKEQLDRLEALGFSRQRALEAWLLCDRNEELAANFLFENMQDDAPGGQ